MKALESFFGQLKVVIVNAHDFVSFRGPIYLTNFHANNRESFRLLSYNQERVVASA